MAEGNILVIDDEVIVCDLLNDILKEKGYKVKCVHSGEEGIRQAKEGSHDVIMTDLKMPDMDGIKVLEEVKKFNPDSTAIVMTGYPSFETVQVALRNGAFDYITKPFDIHEICFLIEKAFVFRNLTLMNKRLIKELGEQNTRLDQMVKEKTNELVLMYNIGQDITSTLRLDVVLETIVDRIATAMELEICSILLLEKKTGELRIKAARGLSPETINSTNLKMGELISGWIVEHKEGVLVEDIEKEPRFARTNQEKYYTHSFISVALIVKNEVIGVINVNNKKSRQTFTNDDFRFVKGIASQAAIAIENAMLYTSLEDSYINSIMALASAVEAKDHYTNKHSQHVGVYATAIAREMGLTDSEIKDISQACQLHDVGKIGIQDYILTKRGELTIDEWKEIKLHSLKSAEILKPLNFITDTVLKYVLQHHERYDGTGYPYGLKGEDIILGARIIAVADSFDAMTTDRSYRKAFTREAALEILKECSNTQFDPKVVEAFLRIAEKIQV